jgi:hypothetical protein
MCCLFATPLNQFRNRPEHALDTGGHRWRHSERAVRFHEIVIRGIQRDRSFLLNGLVNRVNRRQCIRSV